MGDSLMDNGNYFALSHGLLPDPTIYWKGRFSNGPVWPEYMAGLSNGSLGRLADFGYGAALACNQSSDYINAVPYHPPDLASQTTIYLAQRKPSGPASRRNIVVIAIGSNDVIQFFFKPNLTASFANLIGCITDSAARLAAAGETDIVVAGLPPVEQTPSGQALPAIIQTTVRLALTTYDTALQASLSRLQAQVPRTKLRFFSVRAAITQLAVSARAAGVITNATCVTTVPPNKAAYFGALVPGIVGKECASNGTGYFWFDSVHPTTASHERFAEVMTQQFHAWGLY